MCSETSYKNNKNNLYYYSEHAYLYLYIKSTFYAETVYLINYSIKKVQKLLQISLLT